MVSTSSSVERKPSSTCATAHAGDVRGGVEEVFDVAQVLAARFGARAESAFARALEVVPEVSAAAHPDLAPSPGRVARGAARGARQTQEEQLGLLAREKSRASRFAAVLRCRLSKGAGVVSQRRWKTRERGCRSSRVSSSKESA